MYNFLRIESHSHLLFVDAALFPTKKMFFYRYLSKYTKKKLLLNFENVSYTNHHRFMASQCLWKNKYLNFFLHNYTYTHTYVQFPKKLLV